MPRLTLVACAPFTGLGFSFCGLSAAKDKQCHRSKDRLAFCRILPSDRDLGPVGRTVGLFSMSDQDLMSEIGLQGIPMISTDPVILILMTVARIVKMKMFHMVDALH